MRDLITILLSLAVLATAAFTRPRSARCGAGMWLDEGVRASGDYECAPLTPEQLERGPRSGWVDTSTAPASRVLGRVYCGAGERALTNDGVSVLCGAGGWL